MSQTLLFILIIALMLFMHRSRASKGGGCCGGHAHGQGSHDRASFNRHDHKPKAKPDFTDIEEAEYNLLEEKSEK